MMLHRILLIFALVLTATAALAADTVPKVLQRFPPQFPFEAYKEGLSGSALVQFVVDVDGTVSNVVIVNATREDFGHSSAACIVKWKFSPGKKNGRVTRSRLQQTFAFDHPKKKPANQASEPTARSGRGSP